MQKYYIGLLFGVFFNLATSSAASKRDSISVENLKGKKLIIHKVMQHDTYYSISRRYNVTPKEIITFNENKDLQIGVIIKVPTNRSFTEIIPGPTQAVKSVEPPVIENGIYIQHVVQKKENLNFLAEKYGTTINEIKRINDLNTINLRIGQVLKMPVKPGLEQKPVEPEVKTSVTIIPVPVSVPATTPTPAHSNEELIVHTVASNETIYSIATSYKMTMDQLKAKNNLPDNSLRVGQRLLIKGQYSSKRQQENESQTDTISSIKDPSLRYAPSKYGLNQIEERGTGISIVDQDLDPNKMLVLHRTAPIGTVIKITNPMSNRSTFAKVVGKFTENESTKDVIIVMTKAVADALGALDKRFFCNLTYSGQENNEQ